MTENAVILRYNFSLSDCHFSLIFLQGEVTSPLNSGPAWSLHMQSQHPVSIFGIEKVFGSMKTIPAIQKMLVSPDFSTHPVGRELWEESLVLSKIHLSIRADEWIFCPLVSNIACSVVLFFF